MVALLLILVGRLVQLQGFESTKYAEKGRESRQYGTTLVAQRGAIVDRNGADLAVSQESRTITVDQRLVRDAAGTAASLAPLLRMPAAELTTLLSGDDSYAVLAKGIDVPIARRIMELDVPGVSYERSTKRIYPNDALAAGLVGFVNAAGLQSLGDNFLGETAASGQAQIGPAGQAGRGNVRQGMLEASNVNVVEELVDMIECQRAYEINSKMISAVDEMLRNANQTL